ncbi:MAG: dTDP-4-dehydrorhamnose reductase [Lentisphaeria bacterium]|nr:dTDP-4-dehydrorhamnose reductase [Lentisphaeria bacterium]
MKLMITGGKGMLGGTLRREFADCEITVADLPECDITDPAGFEAFLAAARPDAVIHCAAMTAVDRCESEPELAWRLNAFGSGVVAAACRRQGVRLVAISTDYVFAGDLDRPYHEFDVPGARTVYGITKFAGEEQVRRFCPEHLICRISWLYGGNGPSFVHTMLKLADSGPEVLKVVADQIGNPTSTNAVARHLRLLLARPELSGTFHLTCEGEASWYEFAREIFRQAGVERRVEPCTTAEFPRPAPRPANSRLEKRMLRWCGLPPMPDWHDALAEFMRERLS